MKLQGILSLLVAQSKEFPPKQSRSILEINRDAYAYLGQFPENNPRRRCLDHSRL